MLESSPSIKGWRLTFQGQPPHSHYLNDGLIYVQYHAQALSA